MDAIQIHNLSKSYRGVPAVDQLSLTIKSGEFFGFIGPNGAGKSTTIKMLLNMIFPTSGTVEIFGLDCVNDCVAIKKRTGYVSSDVRYYAGMTSMEIFRYVCDFHQLKDPQATIAHYIELFEIDPHKKIADLSLGNKKKIAIVAALLPEPQLLLLDEPTNGLDPKMQHRLFSILKEKNQSGMTIFLSSHDLHEIQEYCDRAAFIKQGKIIAIEKINKEQNQGKRVTIKSPTLTTSTLEKLGVHSLQQTAMNFDFQFDGDFSNLMAALEKEKIDDLTIRNLELEDKFLTLYE